MTIDIKELDEVKKVNKPWGYEKWIADGKPNFKYVLKEILFKSNFKSTPLLVGGVHVSHDIYGVMNDLEGVDLVSLFE